VGLSGHLEGTITALTPLFIPGNMDKDVRQFRRNRHGNPILPGSSLKGLMRSLLETIGPGCWWLLDRDHQDKLPPDFRQCRDLRSLCPACRMFGMMQTGRDAPMLEGHVRFNDGVCRAPVLREPMYTPILSNPKPRHTIWYFAAAGGRPTGRKFYYHQAAVAAESGLRTTRRHELAQNVLIAPLDVGSRFDFTADFESVEEDDLRLLLYALVLEEGMRHKIGYAKPAGLGSIEIRLTRLQVRDMAKRYVKGGQLGGGAVLEGEALAAYLNEQVSAACSVITAETLEDLRRIWAWLPRNVSYQYPTQEWFKNNPQAPLNQAP
jgi:CRISPR-associated protein (TIGR03986 family)